MNYDGKGIFSLDANGKLLEKLVGYLKKQIVSIHSSPFEEL